MNDLAKGFRILVEQYKDVGGRFLKATALELFLATNHDEIVAELANALKQLNPAAVPDMVRNNLALPIPSSFFTRCIGFVDYLEKLDMRYFFEDFLAPANPLIAAALMDMEDEGAKYLLHLKEFFVDSVKEQAALRVLETEPEPLVEETVETEPVEETEETPPAPMLHFKVAEATTEKKEEKIKLKHLTCEACGHKWNVPEAEVASVKECPKCRAPA